METRLKTLEEHFKGIRERSIEKTLEFRSNVFEEEMKRAKTANVDVVRDQLPKIITDPHGDVEFFPEYHNPPELSYWREMRKQGFRSQPLPGLKTVQLKGYPELLTVKKPHQSGWAVSEQIEVLPYANEIFGQVIRFKVEKYNYFIRRNFNDNTTNDIWAFTNEDIHDLLNELSRNKHKYDAGGSKEFSCFMYNVGRTRSLNRAPDQCETQQLSKPYLVEFVFGIKPPTEEEIKKTLMKVHGIKERESDWEITWITPEQLQYPMPKGAFYLHQDAKESGLFERLEFGLLEERRRVVDPVLAGTYQGFRIPLCYWK